MRTSLRWRQRWRALPLTVRDAPLAALVTIVGQFELAASEGVVGSRPLQHLAFAVLTGCLVLRRSRPLTAAVIAGIALGGQTLIGAAPVGAGFVGLLVVTYSVAQFSGSRCAAAAGLLAVVGGVLVYPLTQQLSLADELINVAIPVVVWLAARLARERLDRTVHAEREAARLHAAALEERLRHDRELAADSRRIARECHDVVAHGITVMLLHTEGALATLGPREPAVRSALDVVRGTGQTAVDDLRTLLDAVRSDADERGAGSSLRDLSRVLRGFESTGVTIGLSLDGHPEGLPAEVDLAAYRIVQEAVTNALRHSSAGRIDVHVVIGDDEVDLTVRDDGPGPTEPDSDAGYGIRGIRERATLLGGRVTVGPGSDGPGWEVTAALPTRPTR